MQELEGIKRKALEALAEMGKDNRALNDPAVDRAHHLSEILSNLATFEVMEESKRGGYSGTAYVTSHGVSYGIDGRSYGNDWQHGGNYREQTSREGGNSYGGSYDGRSYADREAERRDLEARLEQMRREDMRR